MSESKQDILRTLPKTDHLIGGEQAKLLCTQFGSETTHEAIRGELEGVRQAILAEKAEGFAEDAFWESVSAHLGGLHGMSLKRVINATGIVLHTNLGRAPLAKEALAAIEESAAGYSNLEFDTATGKRGSRYAHVEDILCRLTGGESALVVNNNAAAVMLVVNTLAKNGEVVTSRGELIEIGGSFRIPEVVERSEAELVEVGATNKTRVGDYADAITENTRILLKVHTSNYKIIGFTEEAGREELVALAEEKGLVVVEDLGSGTLVNTEDYGVEHEPTPREVLTTGVDIVTFSGDKLLGGPQAGIIVGKRDLIERMKKNPLLRALRMDKLTLAALEATLRLYLNPERSRESIPVLAMLHASAGVLSGKADTLAAGLSEINHITCTVEDGEGFSGGGALPQETLPTRIVTVKSSSLTVDQLAEALRKCAVPVIGRIQNDAFTMDVRTLIDGDAEVIIEAFRDLHA